MLALLRKLHAWTGLALCLLLVPLALSGASLVFKPQWLRATVPHADRAVNPQNQAFIDGYLLAEVGARLTREIAGGETTFQVNVENLADEQYWNTAGNGLLGVGAPRTVKFRISRAF